MKKRNSHATKNNGSGIKGLFIRSGVGALWGLGCFIALTLLSSALCMLFDDPLKLVTPMCLFCLYASAFLAGIFSQKRSDCPSILCGALCGAMLTLIFFLAALILKSGSIGSGGYFSPIFKFLLLPCSCLGALVGAISPKKSKKRQKRR